MNLTFSPTDQFFKSIENIGTILKYLVPPNEDGHQWPSGLSTSSTVITSLSIIGALNNHI